MPSDDVTIDQFRNTPFFFVSTTLKISERNIENIEWVADYLNGCVFINVMLLLLHFFINYVLVFFFSSLRIFCCSLVRISDMHYVLLSAAILKLHSETSFISFQKVFFFILFCVFIFSL